jgi:hypothetical protein
MLFKSLLVAASVLSKGVWGQSSTASAGGAVETHVFSVGAVCICLKYIV